MGQGVQGKHWLIYQSITLIPLEHSYHTELGLALSRSVWPPPPPEEETPPPLSSSQLKCLFLRDALLGPLK